MNQLEQLKQYTTVVADTGDFGLMKQFKPQDATTNPSLILRAVQGNEEYHALLEKTVKDNINRTPHEIACRLLVAFAEKILMVVPGRVSTEIDARFAFHVQNTIDCARELKALYQAANIDMNRVLIKVPATWEGITAAKTLEAEGIKCNMTLVFSMPQAIACAEAGVQLISPFVGRIYDWYKKNTGKDYTGDEDPGVQSVTNIYHYYKKFGYKTEIMGASFRNTSQITALAGCDLLTISPQLLEALSQAQAPIVQKLNEQNALVAPLEKVSYDESAFRLAVNNDAMATEKLAEGIRLFCKDTETLEQIIKTLI